ncbi:MAG: hypothetical protein PHC28_05130 [Flavobacterium sp.]|uniref:hypothetical protein n=1 Tax=Flavobacterium sp. TaxID=239 RepID=UPI002623076E|nr:hypothetical protein [Flavobacterium sp.]MDD5149849.1 hypothetical protein [Flavobacterium sp.]
MTKYIIIDKYRNDLQKEIKGGFEGLKILFENYFNNKMSNEDYLFDEVDFEKFVNGKQIICIGFKDYITNESSFRSKLNHNGIYQFSNFYERYFKFNFSNDYLFSPSIEILDKVLGQMEFIGLEEALTKDDQIDIILSFLMYISEEIKKSNECKEIDNPKLFEKLMYMTNGYVEIYDKVFNKYSRYFPHYIKVDFNENVISEINTPQENKKCDENKLWFQVGLLFAKGEIQKFKKQNDPISFKKIAENFGNASFEPYIKTTIQNYDSNYDKNIYINLDKMKCIMSYCKSNDITTFEDFDLKYKALVEKQY